MTTPTPSPRPAALGEMTEAGYVAATQQRDPGHAITRQVIADAIQAALTAAHTAGFVLIPRAELEEAARTIDNCAALPSPALLTDDRLLLGDLANRLRQRSRG